MDGNNRVSQWSDRSGNNRHATQSTDANKPVYNSTNKTITFNGTAQEFLVDFSFLTNTDFMAFILINPTNYTNIFGSRTNGVAQQSPHIGFTSNTTYRMNGWALDYSAPISSNFVASNFNLVTYRWFNSSKQIFANTLQEGTTGTTTGYLTGINGGGTIGFVFANSGGQAYSGSITEMIFLTGANITTQNINIVNDYMMKIINDNYRSVSSSFLTSQTYTNYAIQSMLNASTNLTGVSQVAAGGSHSLALTTSNTVYAWGANAAGQLSLGTTVDSSFATLCLSAAATTLGNVVQVAAGAAHSLFLTTSGTVFACGSNSAGQLADGTTTNRSYPVQVLVAANQPLTQIAAIHATANQSYFLARDGIVYAAGFNGTGAFGNGTTTNSSFAVAVLTPAATGFKAMGYSASYARKRGATVANLITAGYTTLEIVCAGYTKAELVAGGLTPTAMRNAGVTYKQLVFAGYTDSELTAIGYNFPSIVPVSLDGSPLAVNTEVLFAANLFTSSSVTISGQTPSYRNGQYTISSSPGSAIDYTAFNLDTTVNHSFWQAGSSKYNTTTGNYTGGNTTTGIRDSSNISGDWIQIRLPYRLLLRQIGIMERTDMDSDRLPYSFVIVGSNDGTNWNIVYQQLQPPAEYLWKVSSIMYANIIPVTSATTPYSYLRLIARGTKPNTSDNTEINVKQLNFNGDIYSL
jgi:hypothetical protein